MIKSFNSGEPMRSSQLLSALLCLGVVTACQQPNAPVANEADQSQVTAPGETPEIVAAKAEPVAAKSKVPKKEAVDSDGQMDSISEAGNENRANMCWQDYCPCTETITSIDRTICRELKAGREVSDDQFSIGAMARDLKASGDASNAAMDDAIEDTRRARAELRSSNAGNLDE